MNPDLVIDDDHELVVPSSLVGRTVPALTPESEPFWEGLGRGAIVLQRCTECRRWTYLPTGGCPWCGAPELTHEAVDGRGELYSFTVCHLEFGPGTQPPYVVGIIAPDCEPGLRIVTNVVGCRIRDVRIAAPMEPVIVPAETGHLLLYRPAATGPT